MKHNRFSSVLIINLSIRWIIEPGLRLQYYGKLGTSLEPRIGIKYITSENLRLKLAAGNYLKNMLSASSIEILSLCLTEQYHLL